MSKILELLTDEPDLYRTQWPAEPRVFSTASSGLDAVFSRAHVEALLAHPNLPSQYVAVIKGGDLVPQAEYVRDGSVVGTQIRALLDAGGTATFRAMERTIPSIRRACEDLSADLGHPVQANAYLTPRGERGFGHHWDPHLAVVVQVEGEKVWELTRPVIVDPLDDHHLWSSSSFTPEFSKQLRDGHADQTIVLRSGDVLWLPRGWIHNPYTVRDAAEDSLHVTFGIRQITRFDVAKKLLDELVADPCLRVALPPRPSARHLRTDVQLIRDEIAQHIGMPDPSAVTALLEQLCPDRGGGRADAELTS